MAYNNSSNITFRQGEQDVVYATFQGTAPATATIASGSTFTLYDQNGIPVTAMNNVAVTGADAGAVSTGRVWYNFSSAGIAPGIYYGVFNYSITGLDGLVRNLRPDLQISIIPIVEIVGTYNLATMRGQIRLWSRDRDMTSPINSDPEVDSCLAATGYVGTGADVYIAGMNTDRIFFAAAYAFDLMAGDAAKQAIIEKIGAISDNTKVTYDALKDMAKELRQRASQNVLPNVGSLTKDAFYNTPWIKLSDDGNGNLSPVRSPLDSW